jgi:demethylmenaquinone methyltransferase/2-methoxy-6-polyprenyl-1,4-benzoquinol methylase
MDADARKIQQLFARISRPYDWFNHLFSLGIDLWWRRVLVGQVVKAGTKGIVLDLATGSGDVALALQQRGLQVVGADFCFPMLREAQRKGLAPLVAADGLSLPLAGDSFGAITIAFGFRNFTDRPAGLREMLRILRPGGAVFILEFSRPVGWFRPFYYFYLHQVMPRVTAWLAGERRAYEHLAMSVRDFPDQDALCQMLREAGFESVSYRNLTLGIVALHVGQKPLAGLQPTSIERSLS